MNKKHWQRIPIVTLCETHVDCVNRTAPLAPAPTEFKMIRTTNVRDGFIDVENVRYVDEPTFHRWTRRLLPRKHDVILTREAPLGEVGMLRSNDRIFLGQRLYHFRADPDKLDPHFLLYSLLGEDLQGQIRGFGSGSTVEHMRLGDIPELYINAPPIETQRKIAGILSAYDDLIENNLRRIKILEQMAQSLYREWFVHFRFPGHEAAKFKHSELGRIPKGWEVKPLQEIAEFRLGKMLDKKKNKGELMPYLANVNVRWGKMNLDGLRTMRFKSDELETYGLKYGDIVMCEGGEPGRCAVWRDQMKGMMIQKAIHRIRSRENMNCSFLYHSLRYLGQGGLLAAFFTGATIKHLPREKLAKVTLLVPPRVILDTFERYIEPIENQMTMLEVSSNNLRRSRDLLLPKLLSERALFTP
ncbi:restriction endonuclease subunit S [Verrucomicrobiaceae bacterium 227]